LLFVIIVSGNECPRAPGVVISVGVKEVLLNVNLK